jgi:hypothetical protein
VLDWFEDKDTQVFCEFLERYPTLKTAQAAIAEELTQFFQQHRVIRRSAFGLPSRRESLAGLSKLPLRAFP